MPLVRSRCGERRVVVARQRRRQDLAVHAEGDVAAGDLLQLRRERIVEQEAGAQRAEDLAARPLEHTGTVTTCRMPFGCGSRLRLSRPASASRIAGWLAAIAAARGEPPAAYSTWPRLVRDEQQAGVELRLVAAGDALHRRRIVGVDRRLELRQIGDQPRHQRERLGALGAQLIDLRAGAMISRSQRALGLLGHPSR